MQSAPQPDCRRTAVHGPGEPLLPSLGVVIAQTTYATDATGEMQALRQLLEGVLLQADTLQANRPFPSTSPNAAPTS
jgi:hypothetical protein